MQCDVCMLTEIQAALCRVADPCPRGHRKLDEAGDTAFRPEGSVTQ